MAEQNTFAPQSIALTIGGSDCSGGAGIQADLKTFQQFGVYGATAITMLTVQNTQGIKQIHMMSPELVLAQIQSVMDDLSPIIVKTGALGNADMINAIAKWAETLEVPLIVDPVMVSKSGDSLIDDDAVEAYKNLLKRATLVTPNRFELQRLSGIELTNEETIAQAIHELHQMGAVYVLAKLGEVEGKSRHILGTGDKNLALEIDRFDTPHTHGAGCVLSSTITAFLARGASDWPELVSKAIEQTAVAIYNATPIGKGRSPVETRVMELNKSILRAASS
ncbi:bifunctional hydroxymethylpyrimidine kinase/phosphomethylpyrimidine kinase [Pirellulaceae bacterium SH449]